MGIFTCLTSGEQKCGKTKFKAIDYCRNRAYSTNLKIFTRCQLLYEDETVLWRFALPRLGWWRRAQRSRLPTRPLSQSQIKREERLKPTFKGSECPYRFFVLRAL